MHSSPVVRLRGQQLPLDGPLAQGVLAPLNLVQGRLRLVQQTRQRAVGLQWPSLPTRLLDGLHMAEATQMVKGAQTLCWPKSGTTRGGEADTRSGDVTHSGHAPGVRAL